MKNIRFKAILLSLICSNFLYSQTASGTRISIQKSLPSVSAPELTNILRFDKFPDIGFIGGTNIDIPIYTIKLDDMEIPISLSYNTKGFKLNDISPNTGLGWNLLADGTVNLKVNDLNDFNRSMPEMQLDFGPFEPAPPQQCRVSRGYLIPPESDEGAFPFDFKIDSAPDVYSINAPGLKTKFYLEADYSNCPDKHCFQSEYIYKPKFLRYNSIKGNPLSLEAADTHYYFPAYYNVEFKKMEFYNEKGYKYYFGSPSGSFLSRTGTWGEVGNGPLTDNTAPYYDTWRLDYIESPTSNDRVTYTYEGIENNYMHPTLKTKQVMSIPGYDFNLNTIIQEGMSPLTYPSNIDPNPALVNYYMYTLLKWGKRLKNIAYKDLSINFIYNNTRLDYSGQSLDKIEIKFKNKVIKEFQLFYSYFLPKDSNCSDSYDCLRLRLDKVYEQGVGYYTFNYGTNNSDNLLPKRSSSKVDFLGYYNNNSSNISTSEAEIQNVKYTAGYFPTSKLYFYPSFQRDNFSPIELPNPNNNSFYTIGSIDRTPNSNSLTGLLSKITYPTGGMMELEYENDDFNYLDGTYYLGTARIKKMKKTENGNTLHEISYSYKDGNKPSGQINYFIPPNANVLPNSNLDYILGVGANYDKFLNENIEVSLGYNQETYVGYSKVTEIENGNGKTIYSYDNFSDQPDILPTVFDPDNCLSDNDKKYLKFFKFPYKNVQEFSEFRGRIKKKQYYSETNLDPIKEEIYNYEEKNDNVINLENKMFNITGIRYDSRGYSDMGCNFSSKSQVNIQQSYLGNLTTIDYDGGTPISQVETYEYDKSRNLLKTEISTSPDNIVIKSTYKYANDFGTTGDLNTLNMVGIPLEVSTFKNDIAFSKTKKVYGKDWLGHQKVLPSAIQKFDIDKIGTSNEVFENDLTYDQYDSKGNLLQYTTQDGTPVTLIYGYNQTLPILKVEGMSYEEVMATLGLGSNLTEYTNLDICQKSNADIDTSSEQLLITALDDVRNNPAFSKLLITTFTHDPFIGITSITPPSGIRENYHYDAANRLEKIVDVYGRIIKEFKYNYSPLKYYNTQKSQTFTRNNCGSGGIGSAYTYVVPESKYSSIVSQADADQQAQNDINSNGQIVANTNGTCSALACSLSLNSSVGISGGGSITLSSPSYYKISMGFSSGSNSTNLPWTTGVKVATITGNCKPLSEYSSYNGQVYYTITTTGDVIIKTNTVLSNNTSYNYELVFPVN